MLHVAFPPAADDPFPALLPMIGCMARYDASDDGDGDGAEDLYLHGYAGARLLRLSAADEGWPVTVEATALDGLVCSLTPHSHSYNYRSAVV